MAWESRITGHGEAAPADLVGNPRNWRTHPQAQRDALAGVLDEVGWVQDVIVNKRTGYLVDGHARVAVAAQRGEASVPVVYVDLSEDEEHLILATLDPLSAMAEADGDALADLLATVETEDAALAALLASVGDVDIDAVGGEAYSQKVESPIYEPTGDQPEPAELVDRSKADELIGEIEAAKLPDDVSRFLLAAAQRHVIFRFDRIANYYAHAPSEIQSLMERSALVIVDFEQAIERGFVRLNEDVDAAFRKDYPDA